MVTDPDTKTGFRTSPNQDPKGNGLEIGDLCNNGADTLYFGLEVQAEFDNASGACRVAADGATNYPTNVRSLDTRSSPPSVGTVQPGRPVYLSLSASHVNILYFQVTTVNTAGSGFLRVFPYGEPTPQTVDINLSGPSTITHFLSVPVGYGGDVEFAVEGTTTDVVVDYLGDSFDGFYKTPALQSLNPDRIADSRTPTRYCACAPIPPHSTGYAAFNFDTRGQPAGQSYPDGGVVVHVTAVGPTSAGYLTVWSPTANSNGAFPPTAPGAPPATTSVSFAPYRSVGNTAYVKPATDSSGNQYTYFAIYNGSASTLNYLVDLVGFQTTQTTTPELQSPANPHTRIEDTRNCGSVGGTLCTKLSAGVPRTFKVNDRGPVPDGGMYGAFLHVVTLNAAGGGYLQVWNPDQAMLPSSLNQIQSSAVVGDSAYVPISSSGFVEVMSSVSTDVIIEIEGWSG